MIQYNTSQGAFTFKPVSAGGSGAGKINKATFKTEGLTPTLPKLVTEEQLAAQGYVTGAELDSKDYVSGDKLASKRYITLNDIPVVSSAVSLFSTWSRDWPYVDHVRDSMVSGSGLQLSAGYKALAPSGGTSTAPRATISVLGSIRKLRLTFPTPQLSVVDEIPRNPGPVAWVWPSDACFLSGVLNDGELSSAQVVHSQFENLQVCPDVCATVDVVFEKVLNPEGGFAVIMFQWGELENNPVNIWTAPVPLLYSTTVLV